MPFAQRFETESWDCMASRLVHLTPRPQHALLIYITGERLSAH